MSFNLREQSVRYKLSHYIPWNILLCWCLGLWAVLCMANRYHTEQLASQEKATNISECEIIKDDQSRKEKEIIANQRLWESLIPPEIFFRISEVFLALCILLLIVCTQKYVKQELDTVKRLVHKILKPFASEHTTEMNSESNYNATHSDAGIETDLLFGGENERRIDGGGDFHFMPGKIISEVHEVHYYEFPSDCDDAPEFCGLRLRRMKMESHSYTETPWSFKSGGILKPRFITASPEFQEFLIDMKEFTRECYDTY